MDNTIDIQKVLDNHKKWVCNKECGIRAYLMGSDLSNADLRGVDLRDADLRDADLRDADLSDADLRDIDLRNADLRGVDLRGTDLRDADLRNADLSNADLRDTDLRNADLSKTDLRDADLRGANLCGADLSDVNLYDADLSGADLYDADLNSANLCGADLRDVDLRDADLYNANLYCAKHINDVIWNSNTLFFPMQCPERGAYIGFKKAHGLIVELEIPADALRSSATTRKCRASKARVISITDILGDPVGDGVASNYDRNFVYRIGEIVEVSDFDTDRWNECAPGIHHFITREEAVRYV